MCSLRFDIEKKLIKAFASLQNCCNYWPTLKVLLEEPLLLLYELDSPTLRLGELESRQLPQLPSRGVVFLWIRSQNRNGSKGSVRDLWGTNFCKNPRKSASLPCPFNINFLRFASKSFSYCRTCLLCFVNHFFTVERVRFASTIIFCRTCSLRLENNFLSIECVSFASKIIFVNVGGVRFA
jgi:hypothetical protein